MKILACFMSACLGLSLSGCVSYSAAQRQEMSEKCPRDAFKSFWDWSACRTELRKKYREQSVGSAKEPARTMDPQRICQEDGFKRGTEDYEKCVQWAITTLR